MHLAGGLWEPTRGDASHPGQDQSPPATSLGRNCLGIHTLWPASALGKDLLASASGSLFHPLGHWGPGLLSKAGKRVFAPISERNHAAPGDKWEREITSRGSLGGRKSC